MNEEIKLNKRQPTWNYILNDLALYSLMTKVIHSEETTNQEKFDFMYQIELLQQENARLKDKINMAIKYYESNQQECVIGRNKDDKLIKEYYLPAQCSKKMLDILKEN